MMEMCEQRNGHPAGERGRTPARRHCAGLLPFCWTLLLALLMIGGPAHLLALECIQCDRQALWYSPEENERHIARCQKGLIPANRCTNATHTHCIYSYYRQGGVMTVTERRCGTAEEMTGCTLYKSMRARRHFVGGSGTDVQPMASSRRRETGPLVVEVCTGGCQKDGCVSGAAGGGRHCGFWTAFASVTLLLLTTVAMGGGAGGGGAEQQQQQQ